MLTELQPIARDLEQNRQLLDRVMGPMSEEEMAQTPREGLYSGREVLAHLAGANRGMTRLMQRMAAGETPRLKADYNNDYYNARQQEKRAGLSVPELTAELDETHRELLAFMETLTPEDLVKRGEHPALGESTVLEVLQLLRTHELTHLREFGAWAEGIKQAQV